MPQTRVLPSTEVRSALVNASRTTGASLAWLTVVAGAESCFQANAHCNSSSATGLFQFTDQGWFAMLATYGRKHGLNDTVARLKETRHGGFVPQDQKDRAAILAIRQDPKLNALMAGELFQENRTNLKSALHRAPTQGEIYLAHFLGSADAARFIHQRDLTPDASPAELFPKAAKANHDVFFHKDGTAVSYAELSQRFSNRFEHANRLVAQTFPELAPTAAPHALARHHHAPTSVAQNSTGAQHSQARHHRGAAVIARTEPDGDHTVADQHLGSSTVAEKLAERRRQEAMIDHPPVAASETTPPQPMHS
ncbi:hypothetical protein [Telmatospirillum siberiense]|uniref:Transglycosylase SLT domain-containing protein n=1 Tax=Telmatospirillum siberiense TaxID=382514 RepID=A0A2N3PNJ2_9PROT|nr:hypothetical protein [Telmatospirillum siberiense]PKU21950.1 hypothetical protein CWS72_23900 [Telmatospirillum siberiense]